MIVFDKLVLVSGPSGGGKSTLLQLFRSGGLPEDIKQFFFGLADEWPVVDVTNSLRRQIEATGEKATASALNTAPGLVLHYDITSVHRYGLGGYENDPALRLLDLARNLKILFVRPSQSTLLTQFSRRDAVRRSRKSPLARAWNNLLLKRARKMRAWLTQRRVTDETQIYSDPAWVARCYSEWEEYVERLASRTANFRGILHVEPHADGEGRPTFRIVLRDQQASQI